MKEISVPMHITFRIIDEIQYSMIMNQLDASFGTSLIKLSPSMAQGVSWAWTAGSVMAGWSNAIIH